MPIRAEKSGHMTPIIMDRPEKRNAMDLNHAGESTDAFLAFDQDDNARLAVLWGRGPDFRAGWDLGFNGSLFDESRSLADLDLPINDTMPPRGPLVPSHSELSKPVVAAVSDAAVVGGFDLVLWADLRMMEESAFVGVYMPPLGRAFDRRRHRQIAASGRARPRAGYDPDRAASRGRRGHANSCRVTAVTAHSTMYNDHKEGIGG